MTLARQRRVPGGCPLSGGRIGTIVACHALLTANLLITPTIHAQTPPTGETPAPAASVRSCPEAPLIMAQTVSYLSSGVSTNRVSPETLRSPAVQRLRNEFSSLRSAGKLDDPAAVSEAVARSTDAGIAAATRSIEVPGPAGARVLAVYKKPGEIVHRGERIALVQLNGREVPITSKVDGIMQEINISKGGVLANRPRSSAQHRKHSSVRIALITPFTAR